MPPMPTTVQDPGHLNLPPASLVDDAHTQLLLIFNSFSSHLTNEPKNETGVNQPSLILYCPIEGGESIIDTTVQELAQRATASVEMIDIAQCIGEQPRGFWKETPPPGNDVVSPYSPWENRVPYGYFKMHEPVNAAKLVKVVKKAILQSGAMTKNENQHTLHHRIVYLRDFGFLATLAPACYNKVLSAIQKPPLGVGNNPGVHVPTAVILGVSPLLTQGGLFQGDASRRLTGRDSYLDSPPFVPTPLMPLGMPTGFMPPVIPPVVPDPMHHYRSRRSRSQVRSEIESPDFWGEGKDAETHREQRLCGNNNGRPSGSKRIPTCVVVPSKRDLRQERLAREKRRLELNRFEVQMALLAAGGELGNTVKTSDLADLGTFPSRFVEQLVDYTAIKQVADRAIATALASSPDSGRLTPTTISWDAYCTAWKAQEDRDQERDAWLKTSTPAIMEGPAGERANRSGLHIQPPVIPQLSFVPKPPATPSRVDTSSESSDDSSSRSDNDNSKNNNSGDKRGAIDPVVEKVKKQGLSSYQQKLLDCLICPAEIQTGFDSLHLPDATIDEISTLVSLRLVYPEAFHTGILKQHNMWGALLFGPPGTGKTHLVKAIAKNSETRMISIKPSDILEYRLGQEGNTIDALFKLAHALNPCIIFIDEIDSLFGARVKAEDNYSRWHSNVLTQFAQAMDNMLSSNVVVIGATNRPFDLDDAIVRRLPCRILVDLPDKSARVEILRILLRDEQLEPDVDLKDLATLTPSFSGSDLKHVCVMAAFESAKEQAKVSCIHTRGKRPTATTPIAEKLTPDSGEGLERPSLLNGDGTQSNIDSLTRKIAKRHFTYVLKRIQPSTSSTQTSLIELRRWNDQFGPGYHSGNIESDTEEEVIELVKRRGLSSYQQRMLDCLIRPADIPTGFDSVHLPDATIEAMRTLVSLRLVCPDAFKTGILKQYNMSGALLFVPPGTGKTHLVKAIAKESGARMISIKPSNILDKWVGEDEKTIDALFGLARLLKPCIIFIDEIDSLFGARVKAQDGYSRWRTDMLTQFTQEMDGILSSDVIVIGATNRPFDLDDAIIRRLPCRILIDLPDRDARDAILRILLKDELLESDVDITDLASLTPGFSGSDLKHLSVTAAFESAKELANISWVDKKEDQLNPKSMHSPLIISAPRASDSSEDISPILGLSGEPVPESSTQNIPWST